MMPTPIRWGILGTGGIAASFTRDLLAAGCTVTAAGSRSKDTAAAFAAGFGIPHSCGSYEELVSRSDVDVVYIATPHSRHCEDALLAINAGKHVLVEKAFTQNAAQARIVADAARHAGVTIMEAMWTRFLPHMVALRKLLADGDIGEVRTVMADHNQVLSPDPAHRIRNPELAGGALLDLGIYPISFAIDVLGLPSRITARADFTDTHVDRWNVVTLEHPGGRYSVSQSALDQPGPNTATVIGSTGYVVIDRVWYTPTAFTQFNVDHRVVRRFDQSVPGRGMQYEAYEMESLIRNGAATSTLMPIEQTVHIMEVLDEIRSQIGFGLPGD